LIGQRYVTVGRATSRQRLHTSAPAIIGRERIAHLVHGSILTQLMLAMTCVAIALLLYLTQASQVSVAEFNISDLQRQHTQLHQQNADLSAQATTLQSFRRIDTFATTQLHMVKPGPSPAVWIWPLVPHVESAPPPALSVPAAQRQSQPLAWMTRFASFVKSSF
jgi:cell division protein FtsL